MDLGLIEELGFGPIAFFFKFVTHLCRIGKYRNEIAYVSDSSRYVSGIGRYGREIQSHRYTGEYPTRPSHFPARTGRYGTYRPIFRTLERAAVEEAREEYKKKFKKDRARARPCSDLLMQMQLKKENNNIDLSIPPVRLGEKEEVTYEGATIALRKAIRLNCAIQARDGHWAAENTGPMFFTPPLIIILYISGAINTILTREHKKELVRYIYLHQNDDGGWGFYIEGHSTMIGSALSYVALRLLGEGLDGGQDGAMTKAQKWILDSGGATGIPSWGKTYLSVKLLSFFSPPMWTIKCHVNIRFIIG